MSQAGLRWYALAEWGQAEPLMRRALVIDERSYGTDHPDVATASTISRHCCRPPTGWPRPSR